MEQGAGVSGVCAPEGPVDPRTGRARPVLTPEDQGITVVCGRWSYAPEKRLNGRSAARAVTPGVAYAPYCHYDAWHRWRAATYTYLAYLFGRRHRYGMDVLAPEDKPYCVEFYSPDGRYMGEVASETSSYGQIVSACFNANVSFGVLIRNTSGIPITMLDNARYLVGRASLGMWRLPLPGTARPDGEQEEARKRAGAWNKVMRFGAAVRTSLYRTTA